MDKQLIIRNFSRYAQHYDRYADVQRLSALKLSASIEEDNFRNILEIGCGTGNYTLILKEKFDKAKIMALDLSGEMIKVAAAKLKGRAVEFCVGDAEEDDFGEEFDLVTSNACFQWFTDLEKALLKYRQALKKGKAIYFSIFGPRTFWELSASLKAVFKNTLIGSENFMPEEKIRKALSKNFRKIKVDEFVYRESFPRLKGLLEKIKYTGVGTRGCQRNIFFNRDSLARTEEAYLNKFKEIRATYQIFFCCGIR